MVHLLFGPEVREMLQENDANGMKTFCETRFDIDFPLAAISHVRGAQAAPFYAWVNTQKQWQPSWNFNKVLIGRDGGIAGTFGSGDEPSGGKLGAALTAALAAS